MLSCENIITLQALYEEIEKMKGNLSHKEVTLNEKTLKIESLENENTTIEEKNSELNKELNQSMEMLEELKVKNNELICHVATLKGQYDDDQIPDTSIPSTIKTLQDKMWQHEGENSRLESNINTYKEKLMDQSGNESDIMTCEEKSMNQSQIQNIDDCCCKDMSLKLDLLVAENMKYEMKIVVLNKELSQHVDGCGCNEKTSKIDLLIDENMKYEKQIIKLSREWNTLNQISEDLKTKYDRLLLENKELKKQYERCQIESDGVTMYVGQDLQNRLLQLEIEKKKLEISNSAYKNQLMDKQLIIDELKDVDSINKKAKRGTKDTFTISNGELQFQIEQLKEDASIILQENESLRCTNVELQSEIQHIKDDAMKIKVDNDKRKDCFFTKTLEIESILSENAQLRKDSINLHRPCNSKIDNLESQLKGLKEVNSTVSKKIIHLKDKYDAVKWKLKEDEFDVSFEDNHSRSDSRMFEEDDILKVNGMKGECIKLVYVLRRIKKDYNRLKSQLKAVEKEKDSVELENEKLKVDNKNLKVSLDELKAQNGKVEADNLELTASLSLWKHTEAARSSANKILREKLKSRGRPFL